MLEESSAQGPHHTLPRPVIDWARWQRRFHVMLAVIGMTATALLFMPSTWLSQWRLQTPVEQQQPLLALLMLVTVCYFSGQLIKGCLNVINNRISRRQQSRMARAKLTRLDRDERAVLREFFIQRCTVLAMPATEPVVRRLVSSHVLTAMGEQEEFGDRYTCYVLSDDAKPHITSQAIRLPIGDLNEEQLQYLRANRPDFIMRLLRLRRRHLAL